VRIEGDDKKRSSTFSGKTVHPGENTPDVCIDLTALTGFGRDFYCACNFVFLFLLRGR